MRVGDNTPWQVFVWGAAILTTIMGIMFWRTEALRADVNTVQIDVAGMKQDVSWIKKTLEKNNAFAQQ